MKLHHITCAALISAALAPSAKITYSWLDTPSQVLMFAEASDLGSQEQHDHRGSYPRGRKGMWFRERDEVDNRYGGGGM